MVPRSGEQTNDVERSTRRLRPTLLSSPTGHPPPATGAGAESLTLSAVVDDPGPPDGLTLDAAIERMMAANLDLNALKYELPQGEADVLTAGLRANPILYMDTQFIPYGAYNNQRPLGPIQYDVNITHPIDLSHKRPARVRAARSAQRVLEAQYQDVVRRQIGNLYRAFVSLQAARNAYLASEAGGPRAGAGRRAGAAGGRGRAHSRRVSNGSRSSSKKPAPRSTMRPTPWATRRGAGAALEPEPGRGRGPRAARLAARPRPAAAAARRADPDRAREPARPGRGPARTRPRRGRGQAGPRQPARRRLLLLRPHHLPGQPRHRSSPAAGRGTSPWRSRCRSTTATRGTSPAPSATWPRPTPSAPRWSAGSISEVRQAHREYLRSREALERFERSIVPNARAARIKAEAEFAADKLSPDDYLGHLTDDEETARLYRDAFVRHRRSMLDLNTTAGLRLLP